MLSKLGMKVRIMNARSLLFTTSCCSFLLASNTALSQSFISQNSIQSLTNVSSQCQSSQTQGTVLSLELADIGEPYLTTNSDALSQNYIIQNSAQSSTSVSSQCQSSQSQKTATNPESVNIEQPVITTNSDALSQNYIIQNSIENSTKTIINLDSANLGQPHILTISATPGTELTGQIPLNGTVVKKLKDNPVEINISPLLSKGRQTIKISGNYQPAQSSVKVKFSGPGIQVNQQTSGNGILDKTLIIDVQPYCSLNVEEMYPIAS